MSSEPPKPDNPPQAQAQPKPETEVPTSQPAAQRQRALIAQMEQWSGPLPPPAVLEKFNQVVPGSAARILKMAEKEQQHRVNYEREGLNATTGEAKRGQYLGAAISGAAIIGAVISALMGAPSAVPIALVSIPVLGMVRAIVRPRNKHD